LIDCLFLIVERREEKMKKIGTTALLALLVVGLAITAIPATKATSSDDWTQIAQRGLKAYPDLMETVWQKNASAPPNGPYDIIGLHRVVKTGIEPVGVLFICPGTWGSGEQLISNPLTDPWTKTENDTEALYWANRGFDVYSIDYRTHFVPINLNSSQLAFMANWGWDQWISDIKEAVDKTKEVSGAERIYMAGQSFGGIAAMNYATLYGQQDLKGLIMLDAAAFGLTDGLGAKNPNPTNSYNLADAIAQMNTAGAWGNETDSGALFTFQYADQNLGAPAEFPPGTPVTPPVNPFTNEPWTNITEWAVFVTVWAWGYDGISNIYEGYGNAAVDIHICATFDRYWPTMLGLETTAYSDWNNCPDITHDFDDQYSSIDVPLLAFQSQYFGNLVFGPFRDGIANPVFNATVLLGYGHLDVFSGVYCERDVSAPTYDWMVSNARAAVERPDNNAVEDVTPIKNVIGQYSSADTNVTVWCGPSEPIDINLYANETIIGTLTNVTLACGNCTTVTFTWNATGLAKGNYIIGAYATPVLGETDWSDNNCTALDAVKITIPGDITGDFKVTLADLVSFAHAYGSKPGDKNWNPNADIGPPIGIVGLSDLVALAQHYGQHYP
jgi:pimeloyl-ACP methyl ester carboxylesterase